MKIFISWSGERSLHVAKVLKRWLKRVVQVTEPWMSVEDIGAGRRWNLELSQTLQDSSFAIVCVTPESQNAPWVLFEAGAVAKALAEGLVCPYLVDMKPAELQGPLAQFQAKVANHDSTWELVRAVAEAATPSDLPVDELLLCETFDKWWPDLEKELQQLPPKPERETPKRDDHSLLEELIDIARRTESLLSTRASSSKERPMSKRFQMVLDAFGVFKPDNYREIGARSTNYRGYWPSKHPAGLHYEFMDHHDGTIGVEIHIEDDLYRDRAGLLKQYVGRFERRFQHARPYFGPNWSNKRGRLVIAFNNDARPDEIACAMRDLIDETWQELWPPEPARA